MSQYDYEKALFGYMDSLRAQLLARPLNLGGVASSGGGAGGGTGYVGQLPQTRITYDTSELASALTPGSGMSLLDNLNHIRSRITALEEGGVGGGGRAQVYNETVSGTSHFNTTQVFASGTLRVYYNGIRQDDTYFIPDVDSQGFTLVGFSAKPTDEIFVDYELTTTSSGTSGSGGHVIQDEGVSLAQRAKLNFIGAGVTVTDDSANDRTNVTIATSSGGGPGTDEKVKVSANDSTAGYLGLKLVAGSGIELAELTDGGNETLRITCTVSGGTSLPSDRVALLTFLGTLSGVSNPARIYNVLGRTVTISKVFLGVDTTPNGQSIIADVHKNGTTIFTNQAHRPSIAVGSYTGETTTIDVSSWAANEYLQAAIDQVGSIVPGADLVVHVVYS